MKLRIIYYSLFIIHYSLFLSCTNNKPQIADSVTDRAESPRMKATEITTIISDSGITRYRITTKEMFIYDKAAEPYWLFPVGLHFDRFDEKYNVDAQIDCNHATYYDKKQLWVLKDSVKCTNIEGEQFTTNLLHWSQAEERIYSDSAISIQKKTMIINGLGFESNQMMTKYQIRKVTGIIPLDNDSTENQ